MANLKNIIKKISRKTSTILKTEEKKKINNLATFSDKKLISVIGMELHCFYYPEKGLLRDPYYLKGLIKEAERRNLSYLENIKGAKKFLEEFKIKQKEIVNKNMLTANDSAKYFFELAKRRQSIRKFSERKIEKETIYQILQCAIEAPSSCNRQTWRFLILDDEKSLSFVSKIRRIQFLKNAAAVICVLADKDLYTNSKELDYTIYMDGSAAIMNILYAAESLGISSCWVNFGDLEIPKTDMDEFYGFFGIKPNLKPISLVVLGYGTQNVEKPKRELVDYYIVRKK